MKQINLLPKPSVLEKNRKVFALVILLICISLGIYWRLPKGIQGWQKIIPTPSLQASLSSKFPKHSIYKLQMVGYLSQDQPLSDRKFWSMIKSPDGEVSPLELGDHLGLENAKIVDIKPTGIYLTVSQQTNPFIIRATTPPDE